jgi:adenosine/AMP kinase
VKLELEVVSVEKPEDVNVILGQAHFIKTVEDLHEVLAQAAPGAPLGVESVDDVEDRRALLRRIGYKL